MRESALESKIKKYVESLGGQLFKFVSPSNDGMPDRICMLKSLPDIFVETKVGKNKCSKIQLWRHKQLRSLGRIVWVVYTLEEFKTKLNELYSAYPPKIC